MAIITIILAVAFITFMLCCLRVASDADDEMEQMMARDESE